MKKRILSLVLATLMIISVLPVQALADDGPLTTDASGITATKSAEWVNETEGIAKVTITVQGGQTTTVKDVADPTDIVFVIDRSRSMVESFLGFFPRQRLDKAKAAAKSFVEKFLGDGATENSKKNVKIAVVSYNDKAYTDIGLSNNAHDLCAAIDRIDGEGATFIQDGIHKAQEILAGDTRTGVNKIMIVLSDGQPTYSYKFTGTGTYKDCERRTDLVDCYGGSFKNVNAKPDYSKRIGSGSTFTIIDNATISGKCEKHGDTVTKDGNYENGKFEYAFDGLTNHGVGTIWEAAQAKDAGTIIYGVDYRSFESSTMKKVSSDGKYSQAGAENISLVFDEIATDITKFTAYNAVVEDKLGNGFTYYAGDKYTQPTGLTVSEDKKTVTWNVATELGNNVNELKFYVQYDTEGTLTDAANLPTNESAKLTFTKEKETNAQKYEQRIDNATVPNLAKKVTYTVTGTGPSSFTKPSDTLVWKGKTLPVQKPDDATEAGGKYTFDGWKKDGAEVSSPLAIEDHTELTGSWSFTPAPTPKYTVTYQYPDTKPDSETPPTDSNEYAVDEVYTLQTVTAPTGWTFDGWYTTYNAETKEFSDPVTSSTGNKMVAGGVTLYGKWTAPAPVQRYSVIYKFESGTPGKGLPWEVTKHLPTDPSGYSNGYVARPIALSKQEVSVSDGTWTFKGWDADSKTINGADVTFTGTWEFTSTVQPPETTYDVSLTITKTVENVHGTAPAEDYKFVVYYKDAADNLVYLRDVNNPLTIHLDKGDTTGTLDTSVTMTQTQLDSWPYVNGLREVYVEELKGSTDHMSYAKEPVRGWLIGWEFSSMRSAVQYSLASFDSYGAFEFTNVYNKLTDRDVTPAKVSPQLNRDDHVAYLMGYPDGKVRPEGEITRAEACTIFFRLLTEESRDYYFTKTNDYTDVSRSDWFNNAISTLSNAGIVTGYADGTFRPDQPITRGEMAKIIANFARLGGATKSFTDLSGHWAKSYVELAAGNGWIAGYPDGTFGPDKKITRAETVTMINRVLDRVPAKESRLLPRSVMLTFPDNEPGEWYYIAIQEATNSHTYQRSVYETAGDEMWIKLIDNVDWTKLEK